MAITFIDNQPIRFNSAKFDDQSCINKDLSGYSVLMQPGDPLNFQAKQYCCEDNLACDAEEVGAELVTDGDMSNAASWNVGTDWAISGGKATYTPTGTEGASVTELTQSIAITNGKKYQIQIDIDSNNTNYDVDVYLGGRRISLIDTSETGTVTIYGEAGQTGFIVITLNPDFSYADTGTLVINTVSVKEIASCYTYPTSTAQYVNNGTFTGNANGWSLGTGWAYSANNVLHTAGNTNPITQQLSGIAHRSNILFTVTIGGIGGGGSIDYIYGNIIMQTYTTNGIKTFYFPATYLQDDELQFNPNTSFGGTLDDITASQTLNGWDYNTTTGFCHTPGWVNSFYAGNTLTIGTYYQVLIEVIMTVGSMVVEIGGVQVGTISASGRYKFYFTALTTAGEKFTPSSDFDGCIMPNISICQFRTDYEMRLVYEDGTGATDWHTSSSSQDQIVYTDEWVTWKVTSLSSVLSGGIPVELPYSCFKVELRDFCYNGVEDSFQYSSDTTINYKANHPCTKRIRAWSGGIASGFNFGTNGNLFKLIERFETLYFNPTYPNSGEDYEYSTGTLKRIFSKTEKRYELLFNYMDEYAHDTMSVMVVCDIFEMDGVEYLVPFKDYEPQWHERGKRNLAQSTIEIQKRIEKVLINRNCA